MGWSATPSRFVCIEDRGGKGAKRFRVHLMLDGRPTYCGFPTRDAAKEWAAWFQQIYQFKEPCRIDDAARERRFFQILRQAAVHDELLVVREALAASARERVLRRRRRG